MGAQSEQLNDMAPKEPSLLTEKLAIGPEVEPLKIASRDIRVARANELVGKTVRGFRLEEFLGAGPLTESFRALRLEGEARGQSVAVRMLTRDVAVHEWARSLFLRSAYAANRFRHPRVVPVDQDGVGPNGEPFVVRGWQAARPLGEIVRERDPFSVNTGLRIAEQALDALEMAHAHGIVHGALRPENLFITERGSIRLCDFSLPPGATATEGRMLDVLALVRADPFTAPERCGSAPGPATDVGDVFSIAACIYFAISGKLPRGGVVSGPDLAVASLEPIQRALPNVPEDLAAVLSLALEPNASSRYESAYAMLGDIRRVMVGRKPKLLEAARPVPSGTYRELSTSSKRLQVASVPPPANSPVTRTEPSQFRGNLILLLAIAVLVGAATFAVVRERRATDSLPAELRENE